MHCSAEFESFKLACYTLMYDVQDDVYTGARRKGRPHGRGNYYEPNSPIFPIFAYEGEWRNGKPHGRGYYTDDNNCTYEGEWRDGAPDGCGVFELKIGGIVVCSHDGRWIKGEPFDGQGVMTMLDGTRYEGELCDGEFHGQGVLTKPDGTRKEGEFRKGKFIGE